MKIIFLVLAIITVSVSCSEDNPETPCSLSPQLTTNEVTLKTYSSAILSGKIIAPTCDPTVTSQGFVYATTTLPKTSDKKIEIAGSNISGEISSLSPNTSYFVRTFFVNPIGEFYGNQVEFVTDIGLVNISTKAIRYDGNNVWSGGNVTYDGGANIIAKGVCWGTTQNPTVSDNKTVDGAGKGEFDSELTDMIGGETYYLRAYSTNSVKTTYGNQVSFTKTDIYKGNVILTTQQEVDDFGAKKFRHIEGHLLIGTSEVINNSITNLHALQSLLSTYNLSIGNNASLANLNGLNGITSIRSLSIGNNDLIVNLDELVNLSNMEGYLWINHNDNLNDFCGLTKLVENNGSPSSYEITYNAYNPTLEDLINGNCSK